jgi:hypothetical protein
VREFFFLGGEYQHTQHHLMAPRTQGTQSSMSMRAGSANNSSNNSSSVVKKIQKKLTEIVKEGDFVALNTILGEDLKRSQRNTRSWTVNKSRMIEKFAPGKKTLLHYAAEMHHKDPNTNRYLIFTQLLERMHQINENTKGVLTPLVSSGGDNPEHFLHTMALHGSKKNTAEGYFNTIKNIDDEVDRHLSKTKGLNNENLRKLYQQHFAKTMNYKGVKATPRNILHNRNIHNYAENFTPVQLKQIRSIFNKSARRAAISRVLLNLGKQDSIS